MAKRPEDRYTNLASASVTESAVGTMTFSELVTGISLGQGMGILIDQIDYTFNRATMDLLVAASDEIGAGWFTSNAVTTLNINDRRNIHALRFYAQPTIGTPAGGGALSMMPVVHQFFPPLIIAAPRIYFGIRSANIASPALCESRIYFRYIELSSQEYLELAETFILVG